MADHAKKATGQGGSSDVVGGQAKATYQNDQQANHTPARRPTANDQQAERDAKAKRSRSTATEAQVVKLLAFLREGPKTTHFLRTRGIHHPAGRIQNLRDRGHEIATLRVNSIDDHGFMHINVAQYALLREAQQQMPLSCMTNG